MKRTIVALNAVSGFAHVAQFGMIYPLLSLWLEARGVAAWRIGLIGSSVWLGMALGNLYAPRWLHDCGPRILAGAGCLSSAALALLMPHLSASQTLAWCGAAAVLGTGIGLRWIGVESWLYAIVNGQQRGRFVGMHETVIYAAQGMGPALVAWLGVANPGGFHAGAGLAAAGVLPLLMTRVPMPRANDNAVLQPGIVLKGLLHNARHALGVQLGFLAGMMDGILFGMLDIYLVREGMASSQAAFMMMVFGIGALLSQLPLGWWSDRHGVRSATRVIALAGLAGCALLLPSHAWLTPPAVVLLGSVTACGLTVAIIAATQDATAQQRNMGVAVAEVSIAFTVGSTLGPVLTGALMDGVGSWSLPLLAALICIGLYRTANHPTL